MNSTRIPSCYFLKLSLVLFFSTITCEQATSLNGDILQTPMMMEFPPMCTDKSCQESYYNKMLNALRKKIRRKTVTMSFTNGETHIVRLSFCSFSTLGRLRRKF